MEINPKTLVGMVGRRFIRDHQKELADFLGLPYPEKRPIKNIKIVLRSPMIEPVLKTKLGLPHKSTTEELAKEIRRYAELQKELRSFNIASTGDLDKDSDAVSCAFYNSIMGH